MVVVVTVAIIIVEVVGYRHLARCCCQSHGSRVDIDIIIVVCRLVGGDGWRWHCALVAVHWWVADGRVIFVITLVVVALVASVTCVHW